MTPTTVLSGLRGDGLNTVPSRCSRLSRVGRERPSGRSKNVETPGYERASVTGGARKRASERSETGWLSQAVAVQRITVTDEEGHTNQSGVRIVQGRFDERPGTNAANTTTATPKNTNDLRARSLRMVGDVAQME